MSKSCFVIMPFGKNKEEKEFYSGVYESIISPAASRHDYVVNRVDTKEDNFGSITKNIIDGLVYSDLVIADLTGGNANVFYELGIRHALHKCSTILIIQEGYDIPFDLKQHIAVFYSTDIRGIQSAIAGIENAIQKSEKATTDKTDNPVHEFIPSLSFALSSNGEISLKSEIKKLNDEISNYKKILKSHGLSFNDEIKEDLDIEQMLDDADQLIDVGGISAFLELTKAAEQNDVNTFRKLLKNILKSQLLSEDYYIEISKMCDAMSLIPHRIIVLKEGYRLFPNSQTIVGMLADAYSDHPQISEKKIGQRIIEKFLNIEYVNNLPLATKSTSTTDTLLMGLFNIYISLGAWESIVSFCDSANSYGINSKIIIRNKVRALISLKKYEDADKYLKEAIASNPNDDVLQTLMSSLCRARGDYKGALCAQEKALLIDPQDANIYINLSIDILNRGYIHECSEKIIGPIDSQKRLNECIPILNRALQLDSSNSNKTRIIELLLKCNANKEANSILVNGFIDSKIDSIELLYLDSELEKKNK